MLQKFMKINDNLMHNIIDDHAYKYVKWKVNMWLSERKPA